MKRITHIYINYLLYVALADFIASLYDILCSAAYCLTCVIHGLDLTVPPCIIGSITLPPRSVKLLANLRNNGRPANIALNCILFYKT